MSQSSDTRGMFRRKTFWTVLAVCIAPALYVWLNIYIENKLYDFCWEQVCIVNSVELFEPVIILLQVGMALLVLWTIAFRTSQTNTQIEMQEQSNSFNNYLAHRTAFYEEMENIELSGLGLYDKTKLYKSIYPVNSPAFFNPIPTDDQPGSGLNGFIRRYEALGEDMRNFLNLALGEDDLSRDTILEFTQSLLSLSFSLGMIKDYTVAVEIRDEIAVKRINCGETSVAELYRSVAKLLEKIIWFSGSSQVTFLSVPPMWIDDVVSRYEILQTE